MRNKKITAVLLCIVLIISVIAPMSAAAKDGCSCEYTPIVYVKGRSAIYADKDMPGTDDYGDNPQIPYIREEDAKEMLSFLVPLYAECYRKDDFEPFRIEITKCFKKIYKDYALDTNGNPTNNSGVLSEDYWKNKPLNDCHKPNGVIDNPQMAKNEVYKYLFQYDCRLDPCDIADDLKEYIDAVKAVTGHSKVKIIARCLGTNIVGAYFAEYGWDDVEDVILYNAIANGTAITNSLFNGELYFDADAVDFFATQSLSGDTIILNFLCEIITMANKTYGLDALMDYFNMTGTKVARLVVPDIMRVSYATTPGYWSMVSPENYIAARDYIFDGCYLEWNGLMRKLDHYHNTVGSRLDDIYKQMKADGVNVYNISKYGYQLYPIMKDAAHQSDQIVTVEQQAPGTKCAPIGEHFDKKYMKKAEANGTAKYISPDKAIDASESLFPDTTWYIKNMEHNCFPQSVDKMLYDILRSNGKMTVFTNEEYPQYLVFDNSNGKDNGTTRPMTEEDLGYTLEEPGFFDLLISMLKNFIALLGQLGDIIADAIQNPKK